MPDCCKTAQVGPTRIPLCECRRHDGKRISAITDFGVSRVLLITPRQRSRNRSRVHGGVLFLVNRKRYYFGWLSSACFFFTVVFHFIFFAFRNCPNAMGIYPEIFPKNKKYRNSVFTLGKKPIFFRNPKQ